MAVTVGIDALGVDRMAAAVGRSGGAFLRRWATTAEIAYCDGRAERLAGRWAAKEAVIKCFDGTGICVPRRRIEVLPTSAGAPQVRLVGDTSGARIQVSITHHSGLAIAVATLTMGGGGPALLPAPIEAIDLPERSPQSHKGTHGSVMVLAGSLGMTGAAFLSASAAVRSGAGIVRLLVAESIFPILAAKCTEVMVLPVPEVGPGVVGHLAHEQLMRHFGGASCALIGPGLGRDRSTWRLVCDLARELTCPAVLDADALNALADNRDALRRLAGVSAPRVLTPHPGEMARLTGVPASSAQADRVQATVRLAAELNSVVVLKGSHTVIAAPDGRLSEDGHEVPALATGGTGDVLAGLIAGLIAQGMEPFAAAVAGVYIHAEAGRRLAWRLGDAGLLASDLLAEIPVVEKALREERARLGDPP